MCGKEADLFELNYCGTGKAVVESNVYVKSHNLQQWKHIRALDSCLNRFIITPK